MFHEAQEWKRKQTFHTLMVAMTGHAAVWSFKNNLWLITLWPHCCTPRSPVRLFVRYPDICLAGLQSEKFVIFFYMHSCVSCFYCWKWPWKCQEELPGAVQCTPHYGTAQKDGNKKRERTVSPVTLPFLFILCQIFFGEEGGEQKPVRLVMINLLGFIFLF